MRTVIVEAKNALEALKVCQEQHDWYPDVTKQVDSGGKGKAFMCFESAQDARTWEKQK